MSASRGSTEIFSKYQPRPHSAGSPESFVHVAPASSERNTPPCPTGAGCAPGGAPAGGCAGGGDGALGSGKRQSTTAYTRCGFDAATAMPVRPMPALGSPFVSCVHVVPPSTDL